MFFLAAFSYVAQGLRRLHVPPHSFTHTRIGKSCTAIRLTLVYAMPCPYVCKGIIRFERSTRLLTKTNRIDIF